MKKLIYITSCLILLSCLAQNKNIIKKIDVTGFKRETIYTKDSTKIERYTYTPPDQYRVEIIPYKSLIKEYYKYYKDGSVKEYGQSIANGSGALGKRYFYDEAGKVIKIVDHYKDYKFTFDDVQKYAKEQGIDLLKTRVGKFDEEGWTLDYDGYYKGEEGSYIIQLDKTTGEEILVRRQTGRLVDKRSIITRFVFDTIYYKGKYYPPVVYTEETE